MIHKNNNYYIYKSKFFSDVSVAKQLHNAEQPLSFI